MILSIGLLLAATAALAANAEDKSSPEPSKDATPENMVFLVFTETCYDKLVINREIDIPCGKKTLAKVLGYGITVGKRWIAA